MIQKLFENVRTWGHAEKWCFAQHSTSLSGGNLVNGSPTARHTKAFGGPHEGFGPAPVDDGVHRKSIFKVKCVDGLPECFNWGSDHICVLILSWILKEIVYKIEVSGRTHISRKGHISWFFSPNLNFPEWFWNDQGRSGMILNGLGRKVSDKWSCLTVLRVSCVETRLTVHSPLDMQKLLGTPWGTGASSIDTLDP